MKTACTLDLPPGKWTVVVTRAGGRGWKLSLPITVVNGTRKPPGARGGHVKLIPVGEEEDSREAPSFRAG
jgi:hypothetical protein